MKTRSIHKRLAKAGFSIAELMVVILIIGLLATQVVPRVIDQFGVAKVGKAKSDLSAINGALTQFYVNNNGQFPDSLERLVENDEHGKRYLDQTAVPRDPWGNEYVYQPPQGGQERVLLSYGADGQPGGEGDDQDIDIQAVLNGEI